MTLTDLCRVEGWVIQVIVACDNVPCAATQPNKQRPLLNNTRVSDPELCGATGVALLDHLAVAHYSPHAAAGCSVEKPATTLIEMTKPHTRQLPPIDGQDASLPLCGAVHSRCPGAAANEQHLTGQAVSAWEPPAVGERGFQ